MYYSSTIKTKVHLMLSILLLVFCVNLLLPSLVTFVEAEQLEIAETAEEKTAKEELEKEKDLWRECTTAFNKDVFIQAHTALSWLSGLEINQEIPTPPPRA